MKGNIPAARLLEPRALQRLITAWQESGASDESARQAMAAVCAVMGWMYEAGHLEALPPAVRLPPPYTAHSVLFHAFSRHHSFTD